MINRIKFFLFFSFFLTGCAGPGKAPSPGRPSVKAPVLLSKTFGAYVPSSNQSGRLSYKDFKILIDPSRDMNEQADYVFLTQVVPSNLPPFPKNQKIVVPPENQAALTKQGFSSVKGLKAGSMIQLTKPGGFVFLRAVQGKSSSGEAINGYFLEFDNGRNLFFGGNNADADSYRPFLYSLRDEGKEIHMAFLPGATEQNTLRDIIGLLQPEVTILVGDSSFDKKSLDAFRVSLLDQMYEGSLFIARSSDTIPF